MNPGKFSLSLAVSDIEKSVAFYEALGFTPMPSCGSVEDKWLILEQGNTMIGLFEGMFDKNILTFNPSDVRAVEKTLRERGIVPDVAVQGESGPGHCMVTDPDGNPVMFDQF